MNLLDALERLKRPAPVGARPLRVFLACGSTPVHLEAFLAAHLSDRCPTRRIEMRSGVFGDLAGNIERLRDEEYDALAVVIEWPDLDLRLGVRNLGGWEVDQLSDIVASAERSLDRLAAILQSTSSALPTCICLPTLPLPPMFSTTMRQSHPYELKLRRKLASFAEALSSNRGLSIVSAQYLDKLSPIESRFNLRTEITQGISYKPSHASLVAELMTELLFRAATKKALITDLDDTLWSGILGEVGVHGISWSLDQHSQLHGIYQQFLASLASAGVLIGVASKNDPSLVEQAFEREDLLLSKDKVFPIAANWGQKSESVEQILQKWNILPDSVVFVDDSPMEVAEVRRAFPQMECIVFPKTDYTEFWSLLHHLRDAFSKVTVSDEDLLRVQSLRNAEAFSAQVNQTQHSIDDFLHDAEGRVSFNLGKPAAGDTRAFELINKTNQFNLNGRRYDEAAWAGFLSDPNAYVLTVSYEDKFGRLGRIAVLIGRPQARKFHVESWVLSCRAFSRRIEFHTLQYLYEKFAVDEIVFDVHKTPRNGPLMEFLRPFADGPIESDFALSRRCFYRKAPELPHQAIEEEVLSG